MPPPLASSAPLRAPGGPGPRNTGRCASRNASFTAADSAFLASGCVPQLSALVGWYNRFFFWEGEGGDVSFQSVCGAPTCGMCV